MQKIVIGILALTLGACKNQKSTQTKSFFNGKYQSDKQRADIGPDYYKYFLFYSNGVVRCFNSSLACNEITDSSYIDKKFSFGHYNLSKDSIFFRLEINNRVLKYRGQVSNGVMNLSLEDRITDLKTTNRYQVSIKKCE